MFSQRKKVYENATRQTNKKPSRDFFSVVPTLHSSVRTLASKMKGSFENPIENINIYGIQFEKTYSTQMDEYEVPSSGDWSVTRQAALYIENAKNLYINYIFGIGIHRAHQHLQYSDSKLMMNNYNE